MRLEGGKEREERRGHSRLCQFTVVAFSLRWDSSWPSSLLEEPFIYSILKLLGSVVWTVLPL